MSKLIDDLFALQELVRADTAALPETRDRIEKVRAEIPELIAAHFFRQIANGQKGVAYVRHGVCGACHLRLSHGLAHMVGRTNELMVCESCGAFIALAPDSSTGPRLPSARSRRVAKRIEAAAA